MRSLALLLTLTACAPADAAPGPWHYSLASQFGSKTVGDPVTRGITYDKWQGHNFYCTGKRTNPMAWGIANRTLPCGTVVEICKGSLCVMAPKVTTGPFWSIPRTCRGKYSQRCWELGKAIVYNRMPSTLARAWVFANDLDLLPRVAWAVRLGGKAVVKWRVVSIPKRKRRRRK